jgi:hypothetical protein
MPRLFNTCYKHGRYFKEREDCPGCNAERKQKCKDKFKKMIQFIDGLIFKSPKTPNPT